MKYVEVSIFPKQDVHLSNRVSKYKYPKNNNGQIPKIRSNALHKQGDSRLSNLVYTPFFIESSLSLEPILKTKGGFFLNDFEIVSHRASQLL